MAFLKVLVFCFPLIVFAAPPLDLSDFAGASDTVREKKKRLKDNDIIFTDNVIRPEKIIKGLVEIKQDTYGRSKPTYKSKAIIKLRKDYRARFVQFSKSHTWIAIELLNKKKKAWVNLEKVKLLDEEQIKQVQAFGDKAGASSENQKPNEKASDGNAFD